MRTFPTPLSATAALQDSGTTIDVPDGESIAIGYFSESYPEVYRIAEVRQFEDLQTLGLVPEDLSEQDTIRAISEDDASFNQQTPTTRLARGTRCADCAPEAGLVKRRWFQANLAQLLAKSYKRNVAPDGPEVLNVHYHVSRVLNSRGVLLVGIAYPNDVNVGVGSTLHMAPTVHVLNANVITIKSEGVLRFEAANVRVRCNELNGPDDPPVIIPDLDIPKYVIPGELSVGGLLSPMAREAVSNADVLTAHKHLPGFDLEYQWAYNASRS